MIGGGGGASPLGGREVIGLSEIADGPRLFAHPDPVDRQVPGQRMERSRGSLDPALRVGADQTADENHAGEEGTSRTLMPIRPLPR
jgi:hypothetical protein